MAAVTICSDFGAPQNKVCHCFHCFPIYFPWSDGTRCHDLISEVIWPQVSSREGTQLHLSTENWIKDLLSEALSIRTRPNFPFSQFLPSGSFHKPHPSPSESRQTENHSHRNLTNLITGITALSNSMKLWAMPCRATQVRTFCDPMDCSLPGSSIHGTSQARKLEWVATSFSRGPSQPRDRTQVSGVAGRRFATWAIREALQITIRDVKFGSCTIKAINIYKMKLE